MMGNSGSVAGGRRGVVAIVNHRFKGTVIERDVLDGFEVIELQAGTGTDVAAAANGIRAVLVTSTPHLDGDAFELLPDLEVVVRYGIGVDNVDVEAASARGVLVCNVPHYGTDEVAIHAITLALAGVRRVFAGIREARAGQWSVHALGPVPDVREATFGIVGFGHIGRALASKARAVGFRVVVHDAYVAAEDIEAADATPLSLTDLLEVVDVVSLHIPLTDDTRGLIDADALAHMKPTAYLVNAARGGLVDEEALISAVDAGRLAGAALDVLSAEPPPPDSPLLHHDGIVVTPHAAWYSIQAMQRLQRQAAEQVKQALDGQMPTHALNAEAVGDSTDRHVKQEPSERDELDDT